MKKMEPIRDKKTIENIKTYLLQKNFRNYILFVLGINTGFRISDLLALKVSDVRNSTHIRITEKKTGKNKKMLINDKLKKEIDKFIKGKPGHEYLFLSQKGTNKPISRVQAYNILREAGKETGLESCACHTLRKTFGYWHYQQYKDVALLQKLFNHSSPSITLEYIGIDQDQMDNSVKNFYL